MVPFNDIILFTRDWGFRLDEVKVPPFGYLVDGEMLFEPGRPMREWFTELEQQMRLRVTS